MSECRTPKPLVSHSKDESAYMVSPLTARGVAVVIVDYNIAPRGKEGPGAGTEGPYLHPFSTHPSPRTHLCGLTWTQTSKALTLTSANPNFLFAP